MAPLNDEDWRQLKAVREILARKKGFGQALVAEIDADDIAGKALSRRRLQSKTESDKTRATKRRTR